MVVTKWSAVVSQWSAGDLWVVGKWLESVQLLVSGCSVSG